MKVGDVFFDKYKTYNTKVVIAAIDIFEGTVDVKLFGTESYYTTYLDDKDLIPIEVYESPLYQLLNEEK